MTPYRFTSITRITPLASRELQVRSVSRDAWSGGDYVVCRVLEPGGLRLIELPDGRMAEIARGDLLVGALGRRHATLEVTGSFEAVGSDGVLNLLTSAGLLGTETSHALTIPQLARLHYCGHVFDDGLRATMRRYVIPPVPRTFTTPTILLVGTSMSAGKTTAGRLAVRELAHSGWRVAGAKLTGAGRYRDVLSFRDAGAAQILDFVDVGLPSTVVPLKEYRCALEELLARLAHCEADVAVIEIGASPLEPYNGATAIRAIRPHVVATLLAASDPYAVVGVMKAFDLRPDLVCGRAANTTAGIELVERLTGLPSLDLTQPSAVGRLGRILRERLDAHDHPRAAAHA